MLGNRCLARLGMIHRTTTNHKGGNKYHNSSSLAAFTFLFSHSLHPRRQHLKMPEDLATIKKEWRRRSALSSQSLLYHTPSAEHSSVFSFREKEEIVAPPPFHFVMSYMEEKVDQRHRPNSSRESLPHVSLHDEDQHFSLNWITVWARTSAQEKGGRRRTRSCKSLARGTMLIAC